MEWKNFGVLLVALLLALPVAFATIPSTNAVAATAVAVDSAGARQACPTKSTIKVNCNAVDLSVASAREWVGADGCKYECDDDATETSTCPVKGTIKVQCNAADSDVRGWIGPDGCKYECEYEGGKVPVVCPHYEDIACESGTAAYKYVDSRGCTQVACRKIGSENYIGITIAAEPQEVKLYDSFRVYGTVTYSPDANTDSGKQFKVVTSFSNYPSVRAISTSPRAAAIRFESADGNLIDGIVKRIAEIMSPASTGAVPSSDDDSADSDDGSEPRRASGSSGASTGTVTAVTVVAKDTSSQERVDYITLSPGESSKVSAYFTARTPGTKLAKIQVYEYKGTVCPASTGSVDNAPATSAGAPCRDSYKLVAEASTKVEVSGEIPPPPPEEPAKGTIVLYNGWNMVSVPVMAKVSMSELASECGSQPYAWRLGASGYYKEDTLVPGYGYWVKASRDCKLPVSADKYTDELERLMAGWNLVGSTGKSVQISDYKGSCEITAGPWYYNPASSNYVYSAQLSPAKAYWIKVESACRLGRMVSAEDVPPAPPS